MFINPVYKKTINCIACIFYFYTPSYISYRYGTKGVITFSTLNYVSYIMFQYIQHKDKKN